MKRLPSGIADYERLIKEGYFYVDKTNYIEKLEEYPNPNVVFLRPRKFGKTLFTSTLENYYDLLKKDKFEELYGNTYIGKNPTKLRNSYYILKFNFSGIDTQNIDNTMNAFKGEVASSINLFAQKYNLDFYTNLEMDAEGILDNLFKAFYLQRPEEKIYVIIDEYDHFANELLGFNFEGFKGLVSKNGKVRKWYEILKKGTETVVDRIFITGVAPITLDSMTSGFNISDDITRDIRFNSMMGFTEEEIIEMMKKQEISEDKINELLPVMKENYDGFKFSLKADTHMYNSNMTLFFLNQYIGTKAVPENLVDVNIASDYSKIRKMLRLCKGEQKVEIMRNILSEDKIVSEITAKFNPEINFKEKEMVSMLFYLGYLTIYGEELGTPMLIVPNLVMKKIYSDCFLEELNEELDFDESINYAEMKRELALEGKIEKVIELAGKYLNNLSNRDYQRFDEKYIKVLLYTLFMNFEQIYMIKSEMEVKRKYPDLFITPKYGKYEYYSAMIEFKYLKKDEKNLLEDKKQEAREQIKEYAEFEELKNIPNLKKYIVIAVNDEIYLEEV